MAGTETRYCANCGERISARSRFCPACGARQEDFLVGDPEPRPSRPRPVPPARGARAATEPEPRRPRRPPPGPRARGRARAGAAARSRRDGARRAPSRRAPSRCASASGASIPRPASSPGCSMGHLAVPGVVAAGLAALAAAAAVLVAGLLIALATPDASILGLVGRDGGLLTEAFRQAVSTLLAPVIDTGPLSAASGRLAPMIFVAIPIGAVAWATRWQLGRTEGARPAARIAWAAVVGLPFGLLMLAFAVLGGDSDVTNVSPSAGSAFGLGLLWGVIGGVLGAATALPLEGAAEGRTAPPLVRRALTAATATLRPLGALLIACAALGLVGWLVQVGADVDQVRAGRSTATALVEESLFAGEHGVHLAALATGARFTPDATGALGLPFPVDQAGDVPGRDGGFRDLLLHRRDAGLRLPPGPRPPHRPARSSPRSTPASPPPAPSRPRRPALGAAWGAVTGPGVGDRHVDPHQPRRRPLPRRRRRRLGLRPLPAPRRGAGRRRRRAGGQRRPRSRPTRP